MSNELHLVRQVGAVESERVPGIVVDPMVELIVRNVVRPKLHVTVMTQLVGVGDDDHVQRLIFLQQHFHMVTQRHILIV